MRWHNMEGQIALTTSHWVYLAVIIMILMFIMFRREVVVPSLVGILILGLLASQVQGIVYNFINSILIIFVALLNAGILLYDIMRNINLMVSMLRYLQLQGVDVLIVTLVKELMIIPTASC